MKRALRAIAVPTVALVAGLLLLPGRGELLVHLWIALALTLLAAIGLEALRDLVPHRESAFDRLARPGGRLVGRPPSLESLERQVTTATASAYDVHHRLRPLLAPVARELLTAHRVDLEHDRERCQTLLGDPLWSIVDPLRPPPEDRSAAGLAPGTLPALLERLERL